MKFIGSILIQRLEEKLKNKAMCNYSPNEINFYLKTVLVAPLTITINDIPFRLKILLNEKSGMIALDQLRAIDRSRIYNYIGRLDIESIKELKNKINEMLVK